MSTDLSAATSFARAPSDVVAVKPVLKPNRPHFSSGPCAKRPGWSPHTLSVKALGRSHRSKIGKQRLAEAVDRTRSLLEVPDDYRIGIVPASDTGAVEMAMWSLLGPRPVDMVAWESFGQTWVTDAVKQLKLDARVITAPYGALPDLGAVNPAHDLVFTWNGTTSGVRVPNADFIADNRAGLTICDATSAVFAQALDWSKLDVVTFSWQKVLGGEGAHGVLILSPRAVERLERYTPPWPLPKIFRLTKGGKLIEGIFTGATINTPSMLCVEDVIDALKWGASIGGLTAMQSRADANLEAIADWVAQTPWVDFLCTDPACRSNTSVCLSITDAAVNALPDDAQTKFIKAMATKLEAEDAAYDVAGYRDAPPGLRVWCGATVETEDVRALLPWLDWAFTVTKLEML
ncbi:MAG: phosphoserine transaminase [Pseudomonadota bacterium]